MYTSYMIRVQEVRGIDAYIHSTSFKQKVKYLQTESEIPDILELRYKLPNQYYLNLII